MYYCGIGSRSTPGMVIPRMVMYAKVFATLGLILRSGGADGADSAFEFGCDNSKGKKEIYLPWRLFNGNQSSFYTVSPDALTMARDVYGSRWKFLSEGAKKLMARNMYQVLGQTLDTPVKFVLCWTKDGCTDKDQRTRDTGGTGQAIACATMHNIPVFNLYNSGTEDMVLEFLGQLFDEKDLNDVRNIRK